MKKIVYLYGKQIHEDIVILLTTHIDKGPYPSLKPSITGQVKGNQKA